MPSPVKFYCNSLDLHRAAEKHLGFKNVWPEKEVDAEDLIMNLLELITGRHVVASAECTSPTSEEGAIFNVAVIPPDSDSWWLMWPFWHMGVKEFQRVVEELQEMILSH